MRVRLTVALGGAALLVASLVGASLLTASGPPRAVTPIAAETSLLGGVPQDGLVLGDPRAPVTLVEYADVQCPFCAEWALRTMPTLVDDYVRNGKLRIVYRGLAFIGPDSEKGIRSVVAASRDDRGWDVLAGLYRSQGAENAGWVTNDLIDDLAAQAGLDGGELRDRADDPWVDAELARAAAAARRAGVQGTPSFQLGRTGRELELVRLTSLGPEAMTPLIDALLR